MGGVNLNKKLWRIPQQGMVKGVCAGIAHYLDVPVKLVRILVVLSVFFGLAFFTFVAYIVLTFVLDPMPDNVVSGEQQPSSGELLAAVDRVKWSVMSRLIPFHCVAVSANCEDRNEQSLATCRAKG